jgi:hypothetical protein
VISTRFLTGIEITDKLTDGLSHIRLLDRRIGRSGFCACVGCGADGLLGVVCHQPVPRANHQSENYRVAHGHIPVENAEGLTAIILGHPGRRCQRAGSKVQVA